ncbi:MAG: SurA N-terminal domain-containing protein [Acidobacteriota bacterium]
MRLKHVLLVLAGFAVLATSPAAQGRIVDRVAAIVNDEIVTLSDIQWAIAMSGAELAADQKEREKQYEEALEGIIAEKLIQQEVSRTPITMVSDEEVERQHREFDKTFGSHEEHEAFLKRIGMDHAEMHRIIRRQISTLHFIESRFKPFIIVLPDELQRYYEDMWVPKLRAEGIAPPPLSEVEEQVRANLIEDKIDEELEKWKRNARRKANVVILLYRRNPNLPPEVTKPPPPQPPMK